MTAPRSKLTNEEREALEAQGRKAALAPSSSSIAFVEWGRPHPAGPQHIDTTNLSDPVAGARGG